MKTKIALFVLVLLILSVFSGCTGTGKNNKMTKLLYQGHASFRLTAKNGTVIYIDPMAGSGYDLPANIVLVTHDHFDHNQINLVTQKKGCVVITSDEALKDGTYNTFNINGIAIEAVEAIHAGMNCVGYIVTIDGVKLYHAGDTSRTDQMETFSGKNIDYALLPVDGFYTMHATEAAQCAKIIGAKYNIPMHTGPFGAFNRPVLFNSDIAGQFDISNRLILSPDEEIDLNL